MEKIKAIIKGEWRINIIYDDSEPIMTPERMRIFIQAIYSDVIRKANNLKLASLNNQNQSNQLTL